MGSFLYVTTCFFSYCFQVSLFILKFCHFDYNVSWCISWVHLIQKARNQQDAIFIMQKQTKKKDFQERTLCQAKISFKIKQKLSYFQIHERIIAIKHALQKVLTEILQNKMKVFFMYVKNAREEIKSTGKSSYMLLLLSRFSRVQLCVTPQTAAHQAPLSLQFSRQEHWSGLPFPSPMQESESKVAQLCLTLRDPMDCSLPGSSVHGIFQARVLEWGAIAFSKKQLHK